MSYLKLCLFIVLAGLGCFGIVQANPDSTQVPATVENPDKKVCESVPIQVTEVYLLGHSAREDSKRNIAGFGDVIMIKVKGLLTLLRKANCKNVCGDDSTINLCKVQQIGLFIDGRLIKDLSPESGAPEAKEGLLQFHLERKPANTEAWSDILGSPKIAESFIYKKISISVGLQNGYEEDTLVKGFQFKRVRPFWFVTCLAGGILYIFLLIKLSKNRNLLRDRGIDATEIGIKNNPLLLPYSLSRFQMAFWFSLVILSYLFIWLITGAADILTSSVLALIGICGGTSLSATVIDNNKGQEIVNKTILLLQERQTLQTDISNLVAKITIAADPVAQSDLNIRQARLKQVETEIKLNESKVTASGSKGFFLDILSDPDGISFHRLQMLVWTFVLGILFIYSVWTQLTMPEFTATQLALQGITAGTYLGFKIPEKLA